MKYQSQYIMKVLVLFGVFCVIASVVSAAAGPGAEVVKIREEFMPPADEGKNWKLAWSDEFNDTKIDRSKWEILGDWKRRDDYWVKEDSYLDGKGNLIIRTKKDGDRYTSGAMRTRNRFEHKFGYWVCRCKFPEQVGHWPAFWLHTGSVTKVGNEGRDGTEIDIMEKPWLEDKITQNLHWDGYGAAHKNAGGKISTIPGISEGFHTFGLHWKPDEYVFYVDGKETWRTNAGGVSQVPQYMKLTEEIGKWGGDIKKAKLPDYFVVDYVRVYDAVEQSGTAGQKELIRRAVNVRPSARQLVWQQGEFICFIHFGVNTFTAREWGTGKEDPKIFNPEKLDTDQWCRMMKAAGMTQAILTVKHHDGFCLWQTRYTTHSVASSRWRDGKGDVLRDLVDSCRKYGLKVGVYLSPADLYQIENPDGLYGNLSEYSERVIPRPVPDRPFRDKRTFKYIVDDYNEYFLNQLFELLTEYGPIHEVWFDGAHPKRKGGQKYTYAQWYEMIRELAPEAVIFGKGPDLRWCGNEAGDTRAAEWSVIPISAPVDKFDWPDMTDQDLGSLSKLQESLSRGGYLHWYPAETDTSIRRGWFWRDEKQQVKTTEHILDIWYRSVGGNTVLLLNVPPNRDGLFAERDSKVLTEVGQILRETFKTNLAEGATATASAGRGPGFEAANSLDGDTTTCWMPPDWTTQAELVVTLDNPKTFNCVIFQEQIRDFGQRIAEFAVDAHIDGKWQQVAEGQTVGYKRICRTASVTADKVRIRILKSRVCPTISNFALFYAPPIPTIIRN
ncbi:MAG TPA: alpha-L-fucosidase [Sedimentisphaerales bacterium]|nr:alpha-L-fucosidase [Sedimentisphaerales bacterium]